MKKLQLIFLVLLANSFLFDVAISQKAAIKIEAMSIHRLNELGLPNPNSWDNVSTGLNTIGVGTMAWLSGWDTSGATVYKPALSYLWELTSKPAGSLTELETTTNQLTNFRPDSAGDYTVQLTITTAAGTHSVTQVISAAKYTGTNSKNVAGSGFNCASCHAGSGTATTVYAPWRTSSHATMFERGMNGNLGSNWGESCFKCHTTGYNKNAAAVNGGFDDVATAVGFVENDWKPWRFNLFDSLLTTDKKMLSLVGGITCESCHGPKNALHFGGTDGKQPKTMSSGVCAPCHDAPTKYNIYAQWENTTHSGLVASTANTRGFTGPTVVTAYTLDACVRCHDGQAFVNYTRGRSFDRRPASGYSQATRTPITCQTCHDPHSMALRSTPIASDTLGNGYNYSSFNFGTGKTCVNCHKYRRGEQRYITQTAMSALWGPHYAGTTDIFLGQNGHTFGATLPSSVAHQNVQNSCVGCHMSATPDTGTVAHNKIGGHTWAMSYTDPNTSITYDNVTGCLSCHSGITKFDQIKASYDYDKNGKVEAFMKEVDGLKKNLAKLLPPVGLDSINRVMLAASKDSTLLKKAFWNYLYVKYDGSNGVHNPKYVVALLQNTIDNLYYSLFPGQIGAIRDVPNDQGKQVQVIWYKSTGESDSVKPVRQYSVWRLDDSPIGKFVVLNSFEEISNYAKDLTIGTQFKINGDVWTLAGQSPISGNDLYSLNVPTLFDSTITKGMYWTKFKITGHATDNTILFTSRVDSGYSIDNLVPRAPEGLMAKMVDVAVQLDWQIPSDPDVNYFAIYRGMTEGFDFENTTPIGTTTDNKFIDATVEQTKKYYYVVRAFDFSGNKGNTSSISIVALNNTENGGLPNEFALGQNYPNPFNPITNIKYQVPKGSNVSIIIYNAIGQEVVRLVNKHHDAGYYTIAWDGKDSFGKFVNSGIYLYKMTAGNFSSVKKMLVIK